MICNIAGVLIRAGYLFTSTNTKEVPVEGPLLLIKSPTNPQTEYYACMISHSFTYVQNSYMLLNSSTDNLNVPTATLIIYRQLVFPLTTITIICFSDKYRPSKPMKKTLFRRVYSNFKTLILTYFKQRVYKLPFGALALRLPL